MLHVLLAGGGDQGMLDALRERQVHAVPADLQTIERGDQQDPDAIVIDIRSMTGVPGEIAGVRRRHPHCGIVILSRSSEPADLLQAMRAGANEWVADPVAIDDLIAAIRRVARPAVARSAAKIFAIVGSKGGVGGTTVAVNLATSLTLVSKAPSLLIDLHATYGDAAVFLGVDPRFSAADAVENIDRVDETYLKRVIASTPSGTDLLASRQGTSAPPFAAGPLCRLLEVAGAMYRYIVLDCPRTLPALDDVVDAATEVVVVTTQELPALRSASRLVSMLRQRGGDRNRVKVAIMRFDANAEIGSAEMERALGGAVLLPVPKRLPLVGVGDHSW